MPMVMATEALNRLCKWRSVLAGWHTGTRSMTSPGTQAMRDLMDKWLVMRVETSAMAVLLIGKGVMTAEEFHAQITTEAQLLDKSLELAFPGFRSCADGMVIFDRDLAAETMRRKGFPE